MLCGSCGESGEENPCASCGSDPRLRERYQLLDMIGQGGIGTTYRARDLDTDHRLGDRLK